MGKRALLREVAALLLVNGQTSEGTRIALARLGRTLGYEVRITIAWGVSTIRFDDGGDAETILAEPSGVDIGRVIAAETIIDAVCAAKVSASDALASIRAVRSRPPVSLVRFAVMAAMGASALGVVFGAPDPLTLGWIALFAGAGAGLRRALSHVGGNPFVQPFTAALLAGAGSGVVSMLGLDVAHRLVAACPCMILVPGPHFLNGAIDLVRGRIPIGSARLAFASLVVLAICAGLLAGLALTGASFPGAGATRVVPLAHDVVAAGIAVAAYGSFFNMPWRMLPVPIGVGMLAHALRWTLLAAGASLQLGALAASLVVGTIIAPLARRRRMPFGACAFACVVSLIPGVFMFQAASDAVAIVDLGAMVPLSLMTGLFGNAATAGIVLLAMSTGLIVPKMAMDFMLQRMDRGHDDTN